VFASGKLSNMKVLVFYRPNSEHARKIEEFLHDLQHQHDVDQGSLKVLDVDSREGISLAAIYDIVDSPAIVVTDNTGGYVQSWVGSELPLMRDVAAYSMM
jgi:thiol-disulfide isomerase/thioredoxin